MVRLAIEKSLAKWSGVGRLRIEDDGQKLLSRRKNEQAREFRDAIFGIGGGRYEPAKIGTVAVHIRIRIRRERVNVDHLLPRNQSETISNGVVKAKRWAFESLELCKRLPQFGVEFREWSVATVG